MRVSYEGLITTSNFIIGVFKMAETEQINKQLKEHQCKTNWEHKDVALDLHRWSERYIVEFKLHTFLPVIQIEQLRKDLCGYFRKGRNGFGLVNEIAINKEIIEQCAYWEVLATLLHELLHSEQQNAGESGKRNYHNKKYRTRAKVFGLIVDSNGFQKYAPAPSPFINILRNYGVDVPDVPIETLLSHSSKSKLKLWVCSCKPKPVKVRVAISDFQAKCLKCNQLFIPKKSLNMSDKPFDYSQRQFDHTNPTGTGFTYTRLNSNKERSILKGTDYEVVKS